jgi:putative transcriptional regulator
MPKAVIRNNVRFQREKRGMTQTELAKQSGCTRQTIIMLEQEKYVPSLSLAFSIASSLGASVEALFFPES